MENTIEQLPTGDPQTAVQMIQALPMCEFERNQFISAIRFEVMEGMINPTEMEIRLAALEKLIKEIRTDVSIREVVLKDAENYKDSSLYGHKISVKCRKTFDFATSKDSEWAELSKIEKEASTQRKKREEFLKNLPSDMADPDSGEVIHKPEVKETYFIEVREEKNNG